jgi:hypothetical protein
MKDLFFLLLSLPFHRTLHNHIYSLTYVYEHLLRSTRSCIALIAPPIAQTPLHFCSVTQPIQRLLQRFKY